MNFNKQNMQFFLPSMIKHNFEQIFYQNNKIIVYDVEKKQNKLSAQKTVSEYRRPKTGASINNQLSNQLLNGRNKASIQKFILTHKKINEQKMGPQTNNLPKKRYNGSLMKKAKQNNQTDKITLNIETLKIGETKWSEQIFNMNKKLIKPQDKLIKQITYKSKLFQGKGGKLFTNSVDRGTKVNRRMTELSTSQVRDVSVLSGQKPSLTYRSKNPYSLRRSLLIDLKGIQKVTKRQKSNFQQLSKSKLSNKQPQIQNNNVQKSTSSNKSTKKGNDQHQPPQNSESIHPGPFQGQDHDKIITQQRFQEQTNEVYVLPHQLFFQSYTPIINSCMGLQSPKFKFNVKNQNNEIQTKKQNNSDIRIKLSQLDITQKTQQKQVLWKKVQYASGESQQDMHQKLISMQQQQDLRLQKEGQQINNQQQRLLVEQIQNLDRELVQKRMYPNKETDDARRVGQLQNNSVLGLQTFQSGICSSVNSPSMLCQTKKIVLQSSLRQTDNLLILEQSCLKRAKITSFLSRDYYSHLIDLYWVLINQKENALIVYRDKSQQAIIDSQSFKYIKEFDRNRSQLNQNYKQGLLAQMDGQNGRVFVDKEFAHEDIQIVRKEEIRWIHFRPSPQSALFPRQVRLPQHFLMTQQHEGTTLPLIPLLNCLLTINPSIIQRLFQPAYDNIFSCWLNINNHFQPVYIDGYLPFNGKLNSIFAWNDEFLWIGVLIKCCAKVLGGYQKLDRLKLQDWAKVVLGRTIDRLQKPAAKEVQSWNQDQWQDKLKRHLCLAQKKHNSHIIVHNMKTNSLYLIKSIRNNSIKILQCSPTLKKLQVSLHQFLLSNQYEFLLFPQANNLYHSASDYESFQKGNVITYHLKVIQNKTNLVIQTQLSQSPHNYSLDNTKKCVHTKRRILIYEIPYLVKNKIKRQMVLKYSSDNFFGTKTSKSSQGTQTLEMNIPQMKKSHYKIFIECGKIRINDYFQKRQEIVNRWSKAELATNQKFTAKVSKQDEKTKKKYKNTISITSNYQVQLKGGNSLIISDKSEQNQVIQDENFKYIATQMKNTDSYKQL